ncbi:MAG: hypothetical protein IJ525_05385 [Alphaproteobacteria bacterium]|nr:hypothetical protein [Alphaproteobacteria bacterium]
MRFIFKLVWWCIKLTFKILGIILRVSVQEEKDHKLFGFDTSDLHYK